MADTTQLRLCIENFRNVRILCVGDVLLDHYVYGRVERVSTEAPAPIIAVDREVKTLGGAGNVLCNLTALGAIPSLISVVGNDEAGREVGRLLADQESAEVHALVQPGRTTTTKTRYLALNQQLLRADRESATQLDPYIREDLLRLARELVTDHPVVVISDRGKGVVTEGVALEVIRAAREAGTRVIVDPSGGDPIRYRGAHILKPNRRELAHATGMPVATDAEIAAAARSLIERCNFGAVLVSLGADGTMLVLADGTATALRSPSPHGFSASGVGDTVVATLAAALGAGASLEDAAELANAALGLAMSKAGTSIIHATELAATIDGQDVRALGKIQQRKSGLDIVERWRGNGLRIGFAFDGFAEEGADRELALAQARRACDRLVVGLDSDGAITRRNGVGGPYRSEALRAARLASLGAVDLVILVEEETPADLIAALQPDFMLDESGIVSGRRGAQGSVGSSPMGAGSGHGGRSAIGTS